MAVGEKGVRVYAVSLPLGPDRSKMARQHISHWYPEERRIEVAREMYRIRLGGSLPEYNRDINTLRGIEGHRMKALYEHFAQRHSVEWKGRRFDRSNPEHDDAINTSINHSATACYAAAFIAVASTGAIPQLGFIHESSARAFALDIADLFRHSFTLPVAFSATASTKDGSKENLERTTRRLAAKTLQKDQVISKMIDHIKSLLKSDDSSRDT